MSAKNLTTLYLVTELRNMSQVYLSLSSLPIGSNIENLTISVCDCALCPKVHALFKLLPRLLAERCPWLANFFVVYETLTYNQMYLAQLTWILAAVMHATHVPVQVFLQERQSRLQRKTVSDLHRAYQEVLQRVTPAVRTCHFPVGGGLQIPVILL